MRVLIFSFLCVLISSCGSTSSIKNADGESNQISLSGYENIVVLDLEDGTKKGNLPRYEGSNFADMIAAEITRTGAFQEVYREEASSDNTVIVSGDITRYKRGNTILKSAVGFGAGSTYFDAVVKLTDAKTGEELGEIDVDKNSWVLGGSVASSQTIEHFMSNASRKIADEMSDASALQ